MHLSVGACGFNSAEWRGEFYPADLPSDWYVNYYANEFDSVFLHNVDVVADHELLESCIRELDADFYLLLQDCAEIRQMISRIAANRGDIPQVGFCALELVQEYVVDEFQVQRLPINWLERRAESACALIVSSEQVVDQMSLKKLIMHLHKKYQNMDFIFVFLVDALLSISTIKTAQTINDLMLT